MQVHFFPVLQFTDPSTSSILPGILASLENYGTSVTNAQPSTTCHTNSNAADGARSTQIQKKKFVSVISSGEEFSSSSIPTSVESAADLLGPEEQETTATTSIPTCVEKTWNAVSSASRPRTARPSMMTATKKFVRVDLPRDVKEYRSNVFFNEATGQYLFRDILRRVYEPATLFSGELLAALFPNVKSRLVSGLGSFQRAGSEIDCLLKWYVDGTEGKVPRNWVSTNKSKAYWAVLQYYLNHLQSRQVFMSDDAHVWTFLGGLRRQSVGFTPHLIMSETESTLHLIHFYTTSKPGTHNNKPTQKEVQDVKKAGIGLVQSELGKAHFECALMCYALESIYPNFTIARASAVFLTSNTIVRSGSQRAYHRPATEHSYYEHELLWEAELREAYADKLEEIVAKVVYTLRKP
jgi:hypothetical protein